MKDDGVPFSAIQNIDALEANVERVLKAVRGLREDETSLVLAIARYAHAWMATKAHCPDDERLQRKMIRQLLALSESSGKAYAEAMIAEGSIRGYVRKGP
jgi:hypothetical protein